MGFECLELMDRSFQFVFLVDSKCDTLFIDDVNIYVDYSKHLVQESA